MNIQLANQLEELAKLESKRHILYSEAKMYDFEKKRDALKEESPSFSNCDVSEQARNSRKVSTKFILFYPIIRVSKEQIPEGDPNYNLKNYDKVHCKRFFRFSKFTKALGFFLIMLGLLVFAVPLYAEEFPKIVQDFLQYEGPETPSGPMIAFMILSFVFIAVGIVLIAKTKSIRNAGVIKYNLRYEEGRRKAHEQDQNIYHQKLAKLRSQYPRVEEYESLAKKVREFSEKLYVPNDAVYYVGLMDMSEALHRDEYSTIDDAIKWLRVCESARKRETEMMMAEIREANRKAQEKRKLERDIDRLSNQLDRATEELSQANKNYDELKRKYDL